MNAVKGFETTADGLNLVTLEPGVNLLDLQKHIAALPGKAALFWPPDPTETSATVGGIAAAGAGGICTYLYGDTKEYVQRVRLLKSDGSVQTISRDDPGGALHRVLGSEGIAGVFTELTLRLLPKPAAVWGITFFFASEADLAGFADCIRENPPASKTAAVAAMEYMDSTAIRMVEERKANMTKIRELPDAEQPCAGLVYLELHGEEGGIEELSEQLMEAAVQYSSDPDTAWAVSASMDIEKMHALRHGAAETANLRIEELRRGDTRLTKLGTDMVFDTVSFAENLRVYREGLRQYDLPACIFGHIGNNHLHVNIFPEDYEAYTRGIALMRQWAREISDRGGKATGEHGIGKLKQRILEGIIPEASIDIYRKLKAEYDPLGLWNVGNIFGLSGDDAMGVV
jgi:D-lactate dehydrogenase (cytochrome)